MTERIVRIGPDGQLAGILGGELATSAPRVGVVLLSPGMLHRVGNSRLNVLLARHVSELGIPSLRFDFSGIGDSARRPGVPRSFDTVIEETRWAIAELRRATGVEEIVLLGHCAGADVAQRAAVHDAAVTGLVLSDPIVFSTLSFVLRRFGPRLLDPAVLMRIPRTLMRMTQGPENPDWAREIPDRSVLTDELRRLAERRVRLLTIFTGGSRNTYGYEGQYRDAFRRVPWHGLLQERLLGSADHTLSDPAQRRAFLELAGAFIVEIVRGRPASSARGATSPPT